MLRSELIAAVREVQEFLHVTGIHEFLSRPPAKDTAVRVLPILRAVGRADANLSPSARKVIDILGLSELFSEEFWGLFLIGDTSAQIRDERVPSIRYAERLAASTLPKIVSLLARDSDSIPNSTKEQEEEFRGSGEREIKLTLVLPEGDANSSPRRAIVALESITDIYTLICELSALPENSIALVGCDSGSDKLFDFVGIGKAIQETKKFVLEVWDQIIYRKERKIERGLLTISESLTVLEQISQMRDSGALEPERAELLKRRVVNAALGIQESGSTIPELEARVSVDVRALASPDPKLLAGPPEKGNLDR